MTVTVAGVMSYIPGELKFPEDVVRDGQGGVSLETYNRIVANTLVELEARLDLEGIDASYRDHALLNDVAELLVAARITRRLRIHQETADSLFADANMKLRLFYEAVAGIVEGQGDIELVSNTEAPDDWEIDLSDLSASFLDKVLNEAV